MGSEHWTWACEHRFIKYQVAQCYPTLLPLFSSAPSSHSPPIGPVSEIVNIMSNPVDSKSPSGDIAEVESRPAHVELRTDLDEKSQLAAANKSDAIEAENAEHNMGVLEAVRLYPMAALWAFIMSSTIVSYMAPVHPLTVFSGVATNGPDRSWSPTVSSLWALSSPWTSSRESSAS